MISVQKFHFVALAHILPFVMIGLAFYRLVKSTNNLLAKVAWVLVKFPQDNKEPWLPANRSKHGCKNIRPLISTLATLLQKPVAISSLVMRRFVSHGQGSGSQGDRLPTHPLPISWISMDHGKEWCGRVIQNCCKPASHKCLGQESVREPDQPHIPKHGGATRHPFLTALPGYQGSQRLEA